MQTYYWHHNTFSDRHVSHGCCGLVLPVGMYPVEEVAKVLDDIRPWLAQQEGLAEGHEGAWSAFVNRARDNLHIVITMSPVGDKFRDR